MVLKRRGPLSCEAPAESLIDLGTPPFHPDNNNMVRVYVKAMDAFTQTRLTPPLTFESPENTTKIQRKDTQERTHENFEHTPHRHTTQHKTIKTQGQKWWARSAGRKWSEKQKKTWKNRSKRISSPISKMKKKPTSKKK